LNLIWFRNDLRLHANPAIERAAETNEAAVAVVCLTPQSWSEHDEGVVRMGFWRARLLALKAELEQLGIPLRVLELGTFQVARMRC